MALQRGEKGEGAAVHSFGPVGMVEGTQVHASQDPGIEQVQQLVPARDVVVQRRLAHTEALGDGPGRHGRHSALVDDGYGRVNDYLLRQQRL